MKILAQSIFLILMSCTLYCQDLAGEWSGTLNASGNQIRVVFYVSKTDEHYEAKMDSPSQNVSGISVAATNFAYPNVKFEIPILGAVYEGIMSDKGITGKWVQTGTALFLALSKREEATNKDKQENR
jgi:uncharacterized protein